MSKRNSDGDVLTNKLNLGLAKQKSLLASWMGTEPVSTAPNETEEQFNDDDLKQDYAHDRYVGQPAILLHFLKKKSHHVP